MTAPPFRAFAGALPGVDFFVAARAPGQQSVLDQGVENIRAAKDAEADILEAGLRAMSVGADHRVDNPTERCALDVLRGGDGARPAAAGDLRTLREFGELFDGS